MNMPSQRASFGKLQIQADKIRKETFDGRPHTVLPAIIAIDGVMNGAKVTGEELGKYPGSWDGRPIPLLHPQKQGEPVSANLPDVLERRVGTVFNSKLDGDALRAEFWIDDERMDRMGETTTLSNMIEGKIVMEVSTAYFCDVIVNVGEYKGKKHEVEHRNLRPDHVALLPDETGACSVVDGCGVPRVNEERRFTMSKALSVIMTALGLQANCAAATNAELAADVLKIADKLKANGKLTGKQYEALAEMDEEQRGMVGAILGAMGEADKAAAKAAKAKAAENAEGDEEDEDDEVPPKNKKAKNNSGQPAVMSAAAIEALIDKRVNAQVAERVDKAARADVKSRLLANSANTFTAEQIDAMPVDALESYEKSIRPVDYSGQGGFAVQSGGAQTKNKPLLITHGVLSAPAKKEDAGAKAN
jgi:hypothetical protein